MVGVKAEILATTSAHSSGQTSISILSSQRVVTGGSDGEIVVHEIFDSSLKQMFHKRIHKGVINSVEFFSPTKIATAGDDSNVFLSEIIGDKITSRLIHRSSLPLKTISCSNNSIACAGDENKIDVFNEEGELQWSGSAMKNRIIGLHLTTNFLISADANGVVYKYLAEGNSFGEQRQTDLRIKFSEKIKIASWKSRLFLCCPENGLFVLFLDNLEFIDHIRPPNSLNFAFCIIEGQFPQILLFHSNGVCVIDPHSLEGSPDSALPNDEVIIDVIGVSLDRVFAVSSEGNLSLIALNYHQPVSPQTILEKKTHMSVLDSDAENWDSDETASEKDKRMSRKNSRKREANIDDDDDKIEYELNSYDVPSDVERERRQNEMDMDAFTNTSRNLVLPQSIHKSFQPGSTPFIGGYCFLAWNSVGIVTSRQDEGYWSIEVEFNDKNFHHPIRFIDEHGYTMAAVGKSGAIFASPCRENPSISAKIHICPLTTWAKNPSFQLDLSMRNEDILGVGIGAGKYAVIATSQGYLRTISINALQGPIVNYPGKFVSMAASDTLLLLVTTDEFTSQLICSIYSLDTLQLLQSGDPGSRFRNTRITWIGFSDSNMAGMFDENQTLHICKVNCDHQWRPQLDASGRKQKVWPVWFTLTDLIGVPLTLEYPEPIPRPLLITIPLIIPMINIETDPLVKNFEKSYRTRQLLSADFGEVSEKESKKMQLVADKHILELIQLSIKAERLTRVLELCELFLSEKSWDLAVQLVRHNRLASLSNRIEELRDNRYGNGRMEIAVANTSRTNRSVERPSMAMELPHPVSADFMPNMMGAEAKIDAFSPKLFKRQSATLTEQTSTTETSITGPFTRLSFTNTSAEQIKTTHNLTEILHSVQKAAAVIPETNKKPRLLDLQLPPKSKKQLDLSTFANLANENQSNSPNIDK